MPKPHHQRQNRAQQKTGHHREVEDRILAANFDITRQMAESNRQLFAKRQQQSQNHQRHARENQRSPDPHDFIFSCNAGHHTEYVRPRCRPSRIWTSRWAISSCSVSSSRLAAAMASASLEFTAPPPAFNASVASLIMASDITSPAISHNVI